jgi:hypothetical protein
MFKPDRENDELTKALKNKEHTGRTRGLGSAIPWRSRFAEDSQTYRSRERESEEVNGAGGGHTDREHRKTTC